MESINNPAIENPLEYNGNNVQRKPSLPQSGSSVEEIVTYAGTILETSRHNVPPKSHSEEMVCELCQDEVIPAYGFCVDCEEKELLCEQCTKRHIASKKFKHHQICCNLDSFASPGNTSQGQYKFSQGKESITNPVSSECDVNTETIGQKRPSSEVESADLHDKVDEIESTNPGSGIIFQSERYNPQSQLNIHADIYPYEKQKNQELNICRQKQISQKDDKPSILFDKDSEKRKEGLTMCESCLFAGEHNIAASYCLTCQDPEPMCSTCCAQHLKQKLTRDHKICYDIKDLFGANISKNILCEPCAYNSESNVAEAFCITCNDPEPMCYSCSKHHLKQKLSRNHELCNDIYKFILFKHIKDEEFCGACSYDNIKTLASSFCLTCSDPEPMCDECARNHIRQKFSRGHNIHYVVLNLDAPKQSIKEGEEQTVSQNELQQPLPLNFVHKFDNLIDDKRQPDIIHGQMKTKQQKQNFTCFKCAKEDRFNFATCYCISCLDSTPMCNTCAYYHAQEGQSSSHELPHEISYFIQRHLVKRMVEADIPKEEIRWVKQVPGKPTALKIKTDMIELVWPAPADKSITDYYQIRYKVHDTNEKWKTECTENSTPKLAISGLKANTKYIFQVRCVHADKEGDHGPVSDVLKTTKSLASRLLDMSLRLNDDVPPKYQLLSDEIKDARNESAKIKHVQLGKTHRRYQDEKTIMLLGATGSGKTTLVDGIVNYVLGVNFEDPFRFTIVDLEEIERKTHNQAISQTEWITVYNIAEQKGTRINYSLNIIDTPGFGDTRGIERDHQIVDQIRQLFTNEENHRLLYLDCVCFIVKAPDARLNATQRYVFHSIMSLFGKDIESNICTLITFADGAKPPVLASLRAADLPFGQTFVFNNSALYAENVNLTDDLSLMFWEMGCKSFKTFFKELKSFTSRSLALTKDVLEQRENLKTTIASIQPQMNAGLSKLGQLRTQLDMFKKHKSDIEQNKNFTYKVDETKQVLVALPAGRHVTNCLQCNITCHEKCSIADDDNKIRCSVMNKRTGHCQVCIGKCIWHDHKNAKYTFKYVTETVTKTYDKMKLKYEEAKGKSLTYEKYIDELTEDVEDVYDSVTQMTEEMNRCKNKLKEIALRPDPLSAVEHIDLLIQSEEIEKRDGFQSRIAMLYDIKQGLMIDEQVQDLENTIVETRESVRSATGICARQRRRKKRNVFECIKNFLR